MKSKGPSYKKLEKQKLKRPAPLLYSISRRTEDNKDLINEDYFVSHREVFKNCFAGRFYIYRLNKCLISLPFVFPTPPLVARQPGGDKGGVKTKALRSLQNEVEVDQRAKQILRADGSHTK